MSFAERLAHNLYEAAVETGLEGRFEWSVVRDDYLHYAENLLLRIFPDNNKDHIDALRHDLPFRPQGHTHPHRG